MGYRGAFAEEFSPDVVEKESNLGDPGPSIDPAASAVSTYSTGQAVYKRLELFQND